PPMSTRHTPSCFSSWVSTAWLDASCSRMMSSTSRPQRRMHFLMFWAALAAQVTRCTLASRRTPDMPIGSLTPSWLSMMNSWGSTWRISWSAGMATARAASITRSMSCCSTSRSRMATMPWEFMLRMWLPAIPAYTEWMWQPAISSASSMARWMAWTVDSMFTTTPFFMPEEACMPVPTISSLPSGPATPTIATTLEVPMSSPTIICSLLALAMGRPLHVCLLSVFCGIAVGSPQHRHALAVADIDVVDLVETHREGLVPDLEEALDLVGDLAPSHRQGGAVGEAQVPAAPLPHAELDDGKARGLEQLGEDAVLLHHLPLHALRPRQQWQPRQGGGVGHIQGLAPVVEKAAVAPAGDGGFLADHDHQLVRPLAPGGGG